MYKVTCLYGGTTYTLHDPLSDELRIYDDQIETEDNEPGSFQFSISYDHPYIDKIVGMSSDIRVYDGTEEIFRGRPIDDGEDLYRERTFKCEGELAFLYDSIQPRREIHDLSPLAFFRLMLDEHNEQVKNKGPIDKTFRVGTVTVTDSNDSLYRYTNRETTFEDIKDKIIDRLGGHLRVRVSGSYRYLDLLEDVDTVSDQPIQLGDNLLDYSCDTDYTQIATACIPLGASLETTEIAALDAYLTISEVNNGSDCIQITEAVNKYGFICKVVSFDDYTVPENLKSAGEKWLQDGQYANMTLELTAVDLHGIGYDIQPMRKNTQVRVLSEPHGMNRYFEVKKRTYHLTHPETDTVTFGTSVKRTYTNSSKKAVAAVVEHQEQVRRNIDSVIAQERENVTNILNQATHGYVVLDPNNGPERILIMDSNVFANGVPQAKKIWKWDMNGLGYSKNGINGPWETAITMNGEISADLIVTGKLLASLIKVGVLSDINGVNYWNMETGEFRLAATTTVGGKTVQKIAEDAASSAAGDALDGLTAQEVFNKLTDNGKIKGITMSNGGLYINADYINSGTVAASLFLGQTIKVGGSSNGNGKILIYNSSGTETGKIDNNGFQAYGSAKVGTTTYTYKATLDKESLNFKVNNTTTLGISATYDQSGGYYTSFCAYKALTFLQGAGGSVPFQMAGLDGNHGLGAPFYFGLAVKMAGSLTVDGTKSRSAKTASYEDRLLYSYEMPSPMFGDIGEAATDDDGICYVEIDDIFSETVRTDLQYHVFLQKQGAGDIWVEERTPSYFVVKGTPGLRFSWELKAKQRGYEAERLDESEHQNPDLAPDVNLEELYQNDLDSIIEEQEELLYETA